MWSTIVEAVKRNTNGCIFYSRILKLRVLMRLILNDFSKSDLNDMENMRLIFYPVYMGSLTYYFALLYSKICVLFNIGTCRVLTLAETPTIARVFFAIK